MSRLLSLIALYAGTSSASIFRTVGPYETCTAVLVTKQGDHTIDIGLTCFLSDDTAYDVVVADSFVQENFINGSNKSGEVEFDIPTGAITDHKAGTITIPDKSGIILRKKKGSGKISPNKNSVSKSVLVVRVVTTDAAPTNTVEFMSDSVFGTSGDPVNLSSQTKTCSWGALSYTYADARSSVDTRSPIVNGATTVTVNVASSAGDSAVRGAVSTELSNQFGVSANSLANHIMYCMPAGVIPYIAYAYIDHWLSVYSDKWCTYPSSQMHEIGHNLGLSHSGEGNNEYGNGSCMMGYSYSSDDGPLMCYGAPKAWQLGWYQSKRIELSESASTYVGELAGYIENPNDDTVPPMLVKIIVDDSQIDYYLYFNRASGFTSGTREGANTVMISQWNSNGYNDSVLKAKLSAGGSWNIPGFPGGSVVVNSIGNRASVSISFGLSTAAPSTSSTASSTKSPTKSPTASPTAPPTKSPTKSPTASPTASSTKSPTASPTALSTKSPSASPTASSTKSPTASPTASSTKSPTASPTASSTKSPTASPTASSTKSPTASPTASSTKSPTASPTTSPTASLPTTDTCIPAGSNCFSKRRRKGCNDLSCQVKVCDVRDRCCSIKWGKTCKREADKLCTPCPCTEDSDGEFLLKMRRREAVKETCEWLQEQSVRKRNGVCKKFHSHGDLQAARFVCPISCDLKGCSRN